MRFIVITTLVLISCKSASKEDYKKEYDSILVQQASVDRQIKSTEEIAQMGRELHSEEARLNNLYYEKRVDSLKILKDKLDKRRQELSEKLYK